MYKVTIKTELKKIRLRFRFNMNELRYSVPNYCTSYLVKITIFDTCLLQIKQLLFIPWAVS